MSPSNVPTHNRTFVRRSVKYHAKYCSIADVEGVRSEIGSSLDSRASILYVHSDRLAFHGSHLLDGVGELFI